ncbi:zinc-dependent metalloprotease [Prevotella sp.]|uniref:zinc-dependent metalloprotease n=1 Tax=Prevotella sp. TaxID=59823 RepID=UPI002F94E820
MRLVILLFCLWACVGTMEGKDNKKKKTTSVETTDNTAQSGPASKYGSLTASYTRKPGMINVYQKADNYLFEIPKTLLGKDLLLTSRVATTSNNSSTVAGQMPHSPVLITLTVQGERLYMHKKVYKTLCDPESSLQASFNRNFTDPIWKSFKIKGTSADGDVLVDLSALFENDVKELNPFSSGAKNSMSGSLIGDLTMITGVKSFPQNLQVRSQMGYTSSGEPLTVTMMRNIILLPETPMRPRLADPRIGYFDEKKEYFTDKEDGVTNFSYIKRWNIQPADSAAYARGELVEPSKHIVFYVDTAIPRKWRPYIKQGICDWNKAFEKIGFKNVLIAKDYPADDPDFDPDDIRYNCYRMITTKVENSVGPSCSDPRTGEIIQGDVLFYYNSVKLLHNWEFVQTGAVDERARAKVFDSDMTGNSLRYVAAHEVGHTLGLLHNFRASSTIPVDSLRSASFTAKYGTTPSIMDYARYNYVAQPGDKGVNLRPPHLGVYDAYALAWGYKPILEAKTPQDELPVLNRWIREKEGNPMYLYGPQYFFNSVDPSCQSEDLGDNAVKAGTYGINNLKYIMRHLTQWCVEEGKDYQRLQEAYTNVTNQLQTYLYHAVMYVGSIYMDEPVAGDGKRNYRFTDKKRQQEALQFVMKNVYDMPKWLLNKDIIDKIGPVVSVTNLQARVLKSLFAKPVGSVMALNEQLEPATAYTYGQYMADLYNYVWGKSLRGQQPDLYERQLQNVYLTSLIRMMPAKEGGRKAAPSYLKAPDTDLVMPCMHSSCAEEAMAKQPSNAFFEFDPMEDFKMIKSPVVLSTANDLLALLSRLRLSAPTKQLKAHYQSMYLELKAAFAM